MAGFAPEVLAKLGGIGLFPITGSLGKKFYVNGGADGLTHGHDVAGKGESLDTAFLSIAFALTQVVGGRDDYIYCFNTAHQDEAASIVIPSGLNRVHIIGLQLAGGYRAQLRTTGDWPAFSLNPVITGPLTGVEIAGFLLGGGVTHGCIELGGACDFAWIHHCTFGHWFLPASQDGIRFGALSSCSTDLIEDNVFHGNVSPRGRLTQFGINNPVGQFLQEGVIRRNRFIKVPTCAMSLLGNPIAMVIEGNIIGCGANVAGNGITLGPNAIANLVAHNEANFGIAVMAGNNPYSDQAGGNLNDWMCNQVGSLIKYPDEA